MTPLKDLRRRFAEDYAYKPKPKAKRGRVPSKSLLEGETIKQPGDIIIVDANRKGIIV